MSQLIFVTTDLPGDQSDPGLRRLARFLGGVSLPLVLIAAVWTLTVAVVAYVERTYSEPRQTARARIEDVDDEYGPTTAPPNADDSLWRPTSSSPMSQANPNVD